MEARCIDGTMPDDAWVCPASHRVECGSGRGNETMEALYVDEDAAGRPCDRLQLSDAGPYGPGTHTIEVTGGDGQPMCAAELTVVDEDPPVVFGHTLVLWPPNHTFHTVALKDCVTAVDACDGDVRGKFIWASSDEPEDDLGDGHHAPDIQFEDCQHVSLRAERQGPSDGRVYHLGVLVWDSTGHSAEGECTVVVHHDQSGARAVDNGEAYRIEPPAEGPTACLMGTDDGGVEDHGGDFGGYNRDGGPDRHDASVPEQDPPEADGGPDTRSEMPPS